MQPHEIRFALLQLVWPTGPDARTADPTHYMAKVEQLENWIAEADAGQPETAPTETPAKRPRGRPRKYPSE